MKNIVFITAITFPGKEERSKPYKYGLDSWKYWCKKNNCELFVLDEPIFEPEVMVPNFYRYWCFELLDQMNIKYDQILLSDKFPWVKSINSIFGILASLIVW